MSANGGQIVVDFTIDDGKAVVAVKRSGEVLQQLRSTLDSTAASVKKLEQHQDSLGRKFRDIVLTMGNLRFVAMDVNDIFLRLPMAILKSAGELEKLQVLMKGLSKEISEAGKSAEAAKGFDFLTRMARNAPFEIKALSDSFVKFKTAGIDPTNGSMQALVDSVARFGGTGEALKRATVAIQQMAGKGVVSMEELRQQLGEAVPDAMQNMADGMGLSMAELADKVSKGMVAAGPAIDKMLLQMQVKNSGAAERMMNTWVGLGERLKTELALASRDIAMSGFGEAANQVVRDLIAALNSADFKRFADTAGAELKEAVTTISDVVKWLIKYREEIGLVAKAWLSYKAASVFLVPMLTAGNGAVARSIAAYRDQILQVNASALATQRAAAAEVSAVEAASRAKVLAKQGELATIERAMAASLAKQRVLQTAMNNQTAGGDVRIPSGSGLPGYAGTQSVATAQRAQAEVATEIAKQATAAATARAALAGLQAEHGKLATNLTTTTTTLARMEGATNAATFAQRAMAVSTGALRGAFALIGGPIGLVTLALTAGIAMWVKYANAAEEAVARVRRAQKGLSTREDLAAVSQEVKDAEAALANLEKNKGQGFAENGGGAAFGNGRGQQTAAQIEAQSKRIEEARAQLEKKREEQRQAQRAVDKQEADDLAAGLAEQSRQRVKAIDNAGADEVAAKVAARDKITGTDKKSIAERTAATKEATDAEIRRMKATQDALKAEFEKQNEVVTKGVGTKQEIEAARTERDRLLAEINQGAEALKGAIERNDRQIEYVTKEKKDKGAKGKIFTPIERLINELKAQQAELDSRISSLGVTFQKVDDVQAAVDRANARLAKGKDGKSALAFKGKDGKVGEPTEAQKAEYLALVRDQAQKAEALKFAEQIGTRYREVAGDYEQAMMMLADPLGSLGIKDRGALGQEDDRLAKVGMSIEDIGRALGYTGPELDKFAQSYKDFRAQLATVDLAQGVRNWAEETRTLGYQVITNDRERLDAQFKDELELFRKKAQLRIDELAAIVGQNDEVLRAQEELNKNILARQAAHAEAMKTPMEKLADTWKDSTKAMQGATAQWAQQGMDAWINFVKTGKLGMSELVTDVLAGFLKMQMQKNMAGLLSGVEKFFTAGASAFANGGIMSSAGSLPLKKYSKGGIANSPQLALFGEGRQNEAYVPLPDGRSIPVTMKVNGDGAGAGAAPAAMPNVQVNVINQTSNAVNAQQSQPRFDGKQMILDVVLSAANSPGPFRDGMAAAFQ